VKFYTREGNFDMVSRFSQCELMAATGIIRLLHPLLLAGCAVLRTAARPAAASVTRQYRWCAAAAVAVVVLICVCVGGGRWPLSHDAVLLFSVSVFVCLSVCLSVSQLVGWPHHHDTVIMALRGARQRDFE
jgi:hypothetical protein